jgi:hypothetical protein
VLNLRCPSLQETCRQGWRWNARAVHGMKLPVNRTSFALAALALVASFVASACGHEIGDQCKTSVDCDPSGTRSCDLSQPDGYCTIAGCDETSCPSSSACIRTFPVALLSTNAMVSTKCVPGVTPGVCESLGLFCAAAGHCAQCDPAREDVTTDAGPALDDCTADEICLDVGLCAKQSYEQRECAKTCSKNSDCRNGYECRKTGDMGSMLLTTDPLATTSFCAPFVSTGP